MSRRLSPFATITIFDFREQAPTLPLRMFAVSSNVLMHSPRRVVRRRFFLFGKHQASISQ